ncbi:hypothetical protein JTE90_011716 [Oedothorax gibbosus]|uniref:DNA-directed DNA polymerase n=1 Tax=Oedothorax gibbosus TaxID=931172 RepID=A0AAV6TNE2_9ARAC|nr:hypothetical protein JTE90_011716 [Oedothorax gibbosus]
MHLFIEKGTRGGVSMITHRHSKANIPGTIGYNAQEENRHILYLDANNLYGWAMSQPLPVGNFQWIDPKVTEQDILGWADDGVDGFILEVDLDYPIHLHDGHSDYPLAPERSCLGDIDDVG